MKHGNPKKIENTEEKRRKSNRLLNVMPEAEGEEREKGILENIIVEHFAELMIDIKIQIKEALGTLNILFKKVKNK